MLTKPAVWLVICLFLPVGLFMSISFGLSYTTAQQVVWMGTGWLIMLWVVTLVVRVSQKTKTGSKGSSLPDTTHKG